MVPYGTMMWVAAVRGLSMRTDQSLLEHFVVVRV